VLARDAFMLASGQAQRELEASTLNRRLSEEADAWFAERMRVVRAAYDAVMGTTNEVVVGLTKAVVVPSPEQAQRAREAAVAAGKKFEKTCPGELKPRLKPLYLTQEEWAEVDGKPKAFASVRDRMAELMQRRTEGEEVA
jgi:hypothetical protein